MNGTTVDWALRAGSIIVGLLALVVLARALFADRSRGRNRCPKCWYSMDGVAAGDDGLRCPECGRRITHERQLRRTRRKWLGVAVALVLGIVAYGLGVTPRVIEKGWTSAIPSTALVTVWPVPVKDWVAKHVDGDFVDNAVITELDERLKDNELAAWQCSLWQGRVESSLRKEGRFGVSTETELLDRLAAMRITRSISTEFLEEAVRIYQTELGIPIAPDWAALETQHIDKKMLVSVRLFSASGVDALVQLLSAANVDFLSPVEWWVENDKIVVGVRDLLSPVVLPVCSYDFNRLVSRDDASWSYAVDGATPPTLDDRVTLIRHVLTSNVDVDHWFDNGGDRNTISMVGTTAVIRAPAHAQTQIAALLSAMERAWTGGDAATSDVEWRDATLIHAKLKGARLQLTEGPMSVGSMIEALRAVTGVPVDVDWEGLATVNVRPELQVDVSGGEATALQVLDEYIARLVVDSLDGVAWTIHTGAVRIGPSPKAASRRITRVYNVSDLAADPDWANEKGARLSIVVRREITSGIDPEGWVDAGGDRSFIQHIGPLFVISTTSRRHLEIDDLLAKLRAAKSEPKSSTGH